MKTTLWIVVFGLSLAAPVSKAEHTIGSGGAITLSPQLTFLPPEQFELYGEATILGRDASSFDIRDLVSQIAPQFGRCEFTLKKRTFSTWTNIHEYYEPECFGFEVYDAFLAVHWLDSVLVMVRADLPPFSAGDEAISQDSYLPVKKLLEQTVQNNDVRPDRIFSNKKVLFVSGERLVPAWRILWYDGYQDSNEEFVVDARTGETLAVKAQALSLADVYERGPQDNALINVELPDLSGNGYLDGLYFTVELLHSDDDPPYSPDGDFFFDPNGPQTSVAFDAVQAYYGANRALKWFRDHFGFDPGNDRLPIRIDVNPRTYKNNSSYLMPGYGGPAIVLTRGDGVSMANLARDTDVITHEFSHHVIFRTLKTSSGETGILHEGMADYFAYALNGDPYLGETVRPGAPYLRTALLDKDSRFDNPGIRQEAHTLGEVWSAFLWQVRVAVGPEADSLVFQSMNYMAPTSGLRDALIGLLNADRDLVPLATNSPEYKIFGQNKCAILSAAVARGLAKQIADVDGASCNMNLAQMALEDPYPAATTKSGSGKKIPFSFGGKPCAVASDSAGNQRIPAPFWLTLAMTLLPACWSGARVVRIVRRKE